MTTAIEKKRITNKRWAEENPEKQKAAIKRWKENNPDKLKIYANKNRDQKLDAQQKYRQTEKYKIQSRDYWYKSRYGISLGDYTEMLELQHGVCKICHKPETAKNNRGDIKSLVVDHNHTTGQARGLLCHNCNSLIGKAKEDIMILQNAIFYLEEYKDGVS